MRFLILLWRKIDRHLFGKVFYCIGNDSFLMLSGIDQRSLRDYLFAIIFGWHSLHWVGSRGQATALSRSGFSPGFYFSSPFDDFSLVFD